MKDLLPFLVVKTHWQPGALVAAVAVYVGGGGG